jgi:hypothetical protein
MKYQTKLPKTIELIRPDDLLNLRIETDNLKLEHVSVVTRLSENISHDKDQMYLVVDDPARPALLRIIFPPQHIAEFAVFESDPRPLMKVDCSAANSTKEKINKKREDEQAKQNKDADMNGEFLGEFDPKLPLPGTGAFKARIAAPSRLVFRVPRGRSIPFTVEGLLDWSGLEPMLHPIAALGKDASATERAAAPPISAPTADQTSIELPYRLLISPDKSTEWRHRLQPFGKSGRYELWHTRLVSPNGDNFNELDPEHPAQLRAIWSPDYRPDLKLEDRNRQGTQVIGKEKAGRSALSDDDRHQLVVLTSAFHGYESDISILMPSIIKGHNEPPVMSHFFNFGSAPYLPKPFQASQIMLSPLGGWLKSRGEWTPPRKAKAFKPVSIFDVTTSKGLRELVAPLAHLDLNAESLQSFVDLTDNGFISNSAIASGEQLDLSEWVHIATQGRDHYVRVVYEGELWPFRHKAAMVKVTERKFVQRPGPELTVIACLVQRVFIVVREPEKNVYRYDSPLTKVRLTTLVTPNLAEPITINKLIRTFWINVGTEAAQQKFRFHAVGTDHDNREVDFTIPLIFASISDTSNPTSKKLIDDEYNNNILNNDRAADFLGAKLAFTPLKGSENPLLATRTVLFKADKVSGPPKLESAEITISSLTELLGKNTPVNITYDDTGDNSYVKNGYVLANATGVFAKLVDDTPLGFRADQAGGFATPNQTLTALSRDQGPVAGSIDKAMTDSFEPGKIFPQTPLTGVTGLPLLFGTFGLDQLLKGGRLSSQAPKITTERNDNNIVTQLFWKPQIKDGVTVGEEVSVGGASFRYVGKPNEPILDICGKITTPLKSSVAPSSEFKGTLENFDIILLNSVTIHFTEFAFTSRNGEKPDIKVALNPTNPLQFSGDLKFIEELRKAIPPELFGKGASLEVMASGIRAGFSIGLPPLEIGVFALKDVSLGAALTLPFLDGKPTLDFNVSERANPFQLRVAFFAGGGFFHLQMDTKGMRQLEASLEFGAAFGLSIAVATGEVHAMAGIYFAITQKNDGKECTLTGFMRLGGRLSVIGIIRLSVEFNLSFTYDEDTDKAYGRATVTVMVEVLFISVSVALTVERAFGGSKDPVFQQTFPNYEFWQNYASAFA